MFDAQFLPLRTRLGLGHDRELDAAALRGLISLQVREDDGIDFKAGLPGDRDKAAREWAKDVAAFANAQGGVIVVGIGEEPRGVAASAPGVAGGDGLVDSVRQILGTRVRPLIPGLAILWLPDTAPDHGFLVVGVPRSAAAPHTTIDPGAPEVLRWPRRDHSDTAWMSEAELAVAYRERGRRYDFSHQRCLTIETEGTQELSQSDAWVTVSVVPDVGGNMPLRTGTMHRVLQWSVNPRPVMFSGDFLWEKPDASVGLARVQLRGPIADNAVTFYRADLHTDGAAFVARSFLQQSVDARFGDRTVGFAHIDGLLARLEAALHIAARHAVENAGTIGTASAVIRLLPPWERGLAVGHFDGRPMVAPRSRVLLGPVTVETTIDIGAIAAHKRESLTTAKLAGDRIVQAFGIEEAEHVRLDGSINTRAFARSDRSDIREWAQEHGIETRAD